MSFWHRLVDRGRGLRVRHAARAPRRLAPGARSRCAPEAATRYRVLRRQRDGRDPRRRLLLGAARDPAGARDRRRPARVVGRARRDHRLRLAADARELRRRPADRDRAAGAARRPRHVRRRGRGRRGDRPHVHVHPHRRTRRGSSSRTRNWPRIPSQLDDSQQGDVRRDHRAGSAFSRSRRSGRRASRRGRGRARCARST